VGTVPLGAVGDEFTRAMDDDLGTPAALAVVHNTVRQGFTALDGGDDDVALAAAGTVRAQLGVLGLDPLAWPASAVDSTAQAALDMLVSDLLEQRQRARAERDFATADAVRDRLLAAGITVEDTPGGPQWTLKDG
jgi:cysteinyl-tRNA synthetase